MDDRPRNCLEIVELPQRGVERVAKPTHARTAHQGGELRAPRTHDRARIATFSSAITTGRRRREPENVASTRVERSCTRTARARRALVPVRSAQPATPHAHIVYSVTHRPNTQPAAPSSAAPARDRSLVGDQGARRTASCSRDEDDQRGTRAQVAAGDGGCAVACRSAVHTARRRPRDAGPAARCTRTPLDIKGGDNGEDHVTRPHLHRDSGLGSQNGVPGPEEATRRDRWVDTRTRPDTAATRCGFATRRHHGDRRQRVHRLGGLVALASRRPARARREYGLPRADREGPSSALRVGTPRGNARWRAAAPGLAGVGPNR